MFGGLKKHVAPDLKGINDWIHTNPVSLNNLKGKVVGIAFVSRGCINCRNAMPHFLDLFNKYHGQGFHFIAVHTPEFEAEKDLNSLKSFLMKNHLTFPVAVDNDYQTWTAYNNRYWPTLYLIDKEGYIYSTHVGEGGYQRIEHDIIHLLKN